MNYFKIMALVEATILLMRLQNEYMRIYTEIKKLSETGNKDDFHAFIDQHKVGINDTNIFNYKNLLNFILFQETFEEDSSFFLKWQMLLYFGFLRDFNYFLNLIK